MKAFQPLDLIDKCEVNRHNGTFNNEKHIHSYNILVNGIFLGNSIQEVISPRKISAIYSPEKKKDIRT